ncbi:hypothetical protein ACFOEZ_20635 [Tianweitania populi]|uniref:Uncharacterized protein n=1 Tax=Tianweitania populi TaxID=1607949 RepID=A0A8J3GLX7_9HYPH|nr:hypothetical protein [Tianweitania populi]GHD20779.1 hypothetical protein GCM10016234_33430 [Tianweitania populi]
MADSDNTTTLPVVIKKWREKQRRVGTTQKQSCIASTHAASIVSDPAIELLHNWNETHYAASVLCRLQQRQESRSLRLRPRRSNPDVPHTECCNHEAARAAEITAIDEEERLLEACSATSASTLEGVLAKLEMIESAGQSRGTATEFPWPQIRSLTMDLRKVLSAGKR